MKQIDALLNKITMYRLTLYFLIGLAALGIAFGFAGIIPYGGLDILTNLTVAVASCYVSNLLFSKVFKAVTNIESVFISALIITLIFPVAFTSTLLPVAVVSVIAMASKYLLTISRKHIANPAAVAVLVVGFFVPDYAALWWVGSGVMTLPVFIGGVFLMRKIRREDLVFSFIVTFLMLSAIGTFLQNGSFSQVLLVWKQSFISSALFFFAFVMLTEPLTSPVTKKLQRFYGVLVGILYASPLLRLGGFTLTPEMALVVGNIFAYIVTPKYRLLLTLERKIKLTQDTYLFDFGKIAGFKFRPGQYLEWTLPHSPSDARGNRRYFSIVSAPHENLMMAVKFYEPSSSYKKKLMGLSAGDKLVAANLAGDFVLPKVNTPLVFIAGGIGITPFRSMIEDIVEKKLKVDIVVVFANKGVEDIVFKETLEKAKNFGVRTEYVLTDKNRIPSDWKGLVGHIEFSTIQHAIPDFKMRIFYISGPQLMVQSFERMLSSAGVKKANLKVDFFPGYNETSA